MTYEIVKQIGAYTDKNISRESHLVKLGAPTYCRANGEFELYEIDHVIVEALQINDGEVAYQETHVVASDETGTAHPAVLYQATKALTVPEAMFSIGEHNFIQTEEEG